MIAPTASRPPVPERISATSWHSEEPRVADHAVAELVRNQPALRALEERRRQHRFQLGQRLARGGLRHRHRARGLVQRFMVVERDQQLELLHPQSRHEDVERGLHGHVRERGVSRKSDHEMERFHYTAPLPPPYSSAV
jgi:hypothetical protein